MRTPVVATALVATVMMTLAACSAGTSLGNEGPDPTLTPTPTPRPAVDQATEEGPPPGPGAEIGTPYAFSIGGHCGVRDNVHFNGTWWMANPKLRDDSGDEPPGWTSDDTRGTMTLISEDVAVFTGNSGRRVEYVPWPPSVKLPLCV